MMQGVLLCASRVTPLRAHRVIAWDSQRGYTVISNRWVRATRTGTGADTQQSSNGDRYFIRQQSRCAGGTSRNRCVLIMTRHPVHQGSNDPLIDYVDGRPFRWLTVSRLQVTTPVQPGHGTPSECLPDGVLFLCHAASQSAARRALRLCRCRRRFSRREACRRSAIAAARSTRPRTQMTSLDGVRVKRSSVSVRRRRLCSLL